MIQKGVRLRQGYVISPFLFNMYTDKMMREWTEKVQRKGIQVGGTLRIQSIRFADDQCVIAGSIKSLQRVLDVLNKFVGKHRMEINENKTEVMHIGKGEEKP